jgi:hypothetical protein
MAVAFKRFLTTALVEAALQQEAIPIGLDQVLRPGDRFGRAMKGNLHCLSSLKS